MTNRIDWKEMTIAAVGLLALTFNPASDRGRAAFAKYFSPVQGWVEQASARTQETMALVQMQIDTRRATLVEKKACARTSRAQAVVEVQQARLAARQLRPDLCVRRTELLRARNLRLVVVKSTDTARPGDSF
jgi:hypothetical protein